MVVASVTVNDIQILNLLEVVLGSIGGVDRCYTRVDCQLYSKCASSFGS